MNSSTAFKVLVLIAGFSFSQHLDAAEIEAGQSLCKESSKTSVFQQPVPNLIRPLGYTPPVESSPEAPIDRQRTQYLSGLTDRVFKNWEPGKLSNNTTVRVSFHIATNGDFNNICVSKSSGIERLDFTCVEAVAESAKFEKAPLGFADRDAEVLFRAADSKNQYDCAAVSEIKPGYIAFHLIPLDTLQALPMLDPKLVHSRSNIYALPKEMVNSGELTDFRSAWVEFLRPQKKLSAKSILKESKLLHRKYIELFRRSGAAQ